MSNDPGLRAHADCSPGQPCLSGRGECPYENQPVTTDKDRPVTSLNETTTHPSTDPIKSAWGPALGILAVPVVALSAMLLIDPIFGDDMDTDHLTQAADTVREQMDGAQTDQVTRTVLPIRNASIVAWVDYDSDDWSMCLFTSDGSPTGEGSNHLIFNGTGTYVVETGSCPATRTLNVPSEER